MMVQQWHNRQIQYWKAGLACSSPCREAVRNQTSTTPQLCVRLPALHTLNTKCLKKSGTPSRLPTCYSNPVFPVQVWKASTVPFCFLFTLHNATKIAASGNASYWHSQFPKQRLTSFQQQNTSTYSLGSGLTVVRVDQNWSFLPTPTVLQWWPMPFELLLVQISEVRKLHHAVEGCVTTENTIMCCDSTSTW